MAKMSTKAKKLLDKKVITGAIVASLLLAVLSPLLDPLVAKGQQKVASLWQNLTGGSGSGEGGEGE